ncbi:hypothetical protein PHMEG_00028536 [Phytophthora megakarya]|uniref:Uncharacterized protein n=1 Tax=Phytophthora megakarya TaxID=4795 RepID=A0A225V699_9STRA|nr:hypothetical protein PHMEG_00028536 [Phytophthora megakarya]
MFNPSVYSQTYIKRLEILCLRQFERGNQQVRLATADEWTVIEGMMDGHIVCRELPQFVDEDARLKLYGTVLVQVEGELTLRLSGREKLQSLQLNMKAIEEAF